MHARSISKTLLSIRLATSATCFWAPPTPMSSMTIRILRLRCTGAIIEPRPLRSRQGEPLLPRAASTAVIGTWPTCLRRPLCPLKKCIPATTSTASTGTFARTVSRTLPASPSPSTPAKMSLPPRRPAVERLCDEELSACLRARPPLALVEANDADASVLVPEDRAKVARGDDDVAAPGVRSNRPRGVQHDVVARVPAVREIEREVRNGKCDDRHEGRPGRRPWAASAGAHATTAKVTGMVHHSKLAASKYEPNAA